MEEKPYLNAKFKPGVFDYSGLGGGTYWCADGEAVSCTRLEAKAFADLDGLRLIYVDRQRGSSGYTPDWENHLAEPLELTGVPRLTLL